MNAKTFLDSNVLIYAYDNSDKLKQNHAQKILNQGLADNNIVLSVQVRDVINQVDIQIVQIDVPLVLNAQSRILYNCHKAL